MDVVAAAMDGDRQAFAALVDRYKNMVSAIALAQVRDKAMSEDVAQNALVEAWRGLGRLRNKDSFGPWLAQLVRRQALQAVRAQKRTQQREQTWQREQVMHDTPFTEPAEDLRPLYDALERIPDDAREVLVLYYREERSAEQVGALLGLSTQAVRKRVQRARDVLRDELDRVGALAKKSAPAAAFVALVLAGLDAEGAPMPAPAASALGLPAAVVLGALACSAFAFLFPWHGAPKAPPPSANESASAPAPVAVREFFARSVVTPAPAPASAPVHAHQGRVFDFDGLPLAHRQVHFWAWGQTEEDAISDDDGRFFLDRVSGRCRAYVARDEARVTDAQAATQRVTPFSANALWGQWVEVGDQPIDIAVPRSGLVMGEVLGPAGRFVRIFRTEEIGGWFPIFGQLVPLEQDGTFSLSLPGGTYFMRSDRKDVGKTVVVKSGESASALIDNRAEATLTVHVTSADDRSIAEADVSIRAKNGEFELDPTDENGDTSFYQPPDRIAGGTLFAEKDGQTASAIFGDSHEVTLRLSAAGSLTVHLHGWSGERVLALVSHDGAGLGHDSDATPGASFPQYFTENPIVLPVVGPGPVHVRVTNLDFTASAAGAVTVASGANASLDLTLQKSGHVHGRVVSHGGELPSPLPMTVFLGLPMHVQPSGDFSFDAPAGDNTLEIQAFGRVVSTQTLTVHPGETLKLGDLRI